MGHMDFNYDSTGGGKLQEEIDYARNSIVWPFILNHTQFTLSWADKTYPLTIGGEEALVALIAVCITMNDDQLAQVLQTQQLSGKGVFVNV
jgi:hypothetical protein